MKCTLRWSCCKLVRLTVACHSPVLWLECGKRHRTQNWKSVCEAPPLLHRHPKLTWHCANWAEAPARIHFSIIDDYVLCAVHYFPPRWTSSPAKCLQGGVRGRRRRLLIKWKTQLDGSGREGVVVGGGFYLTFLQGVSETWMIRSHQKRVHISGFLRRFTPPPTTHTHTPSAMVAAYWWAIGLITLKLASRLVSGSISARIGPFMQFCPASLIYRSDPGWSKYRR